MFKFTDNKTFHKITFLFIIPKAVINKIWSKSRDCGIAFNAQFNVNFYFVMKKDIKALSFEWIKP